MVQQPWMPPLDPLVYILYIYIYIYIFLHVHSFGKCIIFPKST